MVSCHLLKSPSQKNTSQEAPSALAKSLQELAHIWKMVAEGMIMMYATFLPATGLAAPVSPPCWVSFWPPLLLPPQATSANTMDSAKSIDKTLLFIVSSS